ncbi:TonB-dependent siderophore receptor [Vibrio rotiferianus]|uniref:TonB-dependent receptor n=1 Tax=Vibrio rotiferianus TaxID=190895 RepID=UPI001110015C|nr:TonB-dependent receptor [Vibrio rotiferianus]TMX31564.1 TonB-dependent siderophore receptor [Vibrio rotiferianus]TMX58424.1 TonB-dependent siderophore receptor [Vibrio rotiferianus]TMX63693.1 TonB-dependent siderophore receptor [Vibrio rotiferianus]
MIKRKFSLNLIVLAMSSGYAFHALADQPNPNKQSNTDEQMVVVGSIMPKSISDIPGTVWFVDQEQIAQQYRAGKSLGDILSATIPSLDVGTGGRTNYAQNLRGRAMLVMIDGVSLQSSRPISRQLDAIDPFNIERIEVLSGATSIYGAGATGGVINIVTKKATSDELSFESYVSGTTGFNNSDDFDYKVAQSISGGNEQITARGSVVYGETQGFYDGNGDIVTPDISQGSLQYNSTLDVMGSAEIQTSDESQLGLIAQYYDSQQDSPYGLYIVGRDFVDVREGFESDREQGTERILLSANYSHDSVFGHQLIGELSYRSESQTFTPYFQSASQQETEVLAGRLALAKGWDALNLVYGVDAYLDRFDSNQALFDSTIANDSGNLVNKTYAQVGRYPGVDVSSYALFIQGDYEINADWSIQAGYRYQYMNNKIDDFVAYSVQKKIAAGTGTSADAVPGGSTDYSVSLFNLGTIYELNDDSQIWANFSQGFQLADPAKYYGQGSYDAPDANGHYALKDSINVSDSKLSGIKTDSYELGYRLDTDSLSLQAAGYYSQSDNSIKYDRKTLLITSVDDEQRVYGAEANINYWVTSDILLGASGHYVVSELKTDGKWEDLSAGKASTSKANAWAAWYQNDYSLRLQSQTMFDYKDEADNKLDGYTTFDLLGNVMLPVGQLGFGIQNLFNEDYTTVWGQRAQILYASHYDSAAYDYKGRGRTFTLNYSLEY